MYVAGSCVYDRPADAEALHFSMFSPLIYALLASSSVGAVWPKLCGLTEIRNRKHRLKSVAFTGTPTHVRADTELGVSAACPRVW